MLDEYNHAMIQLREGYIPGPLLTKLSECDDNRIRKRIKLLIPEANMKQLKDLSEEDDKWIGKEIDNLNILAIYAGCFLSEKPDVKEILFNKILEHYKGGIIKGNHLTYLDIQINSDLYFLTNDISYLESCINLAKSNDDYIRDHRLNIGEKYYRIGYYYDCGGMFNLARIAYEKGIKYGNVICKNRLYAIHFLRFKSDLNTLSDIETIVVV